ncbi:kanamycin kinase/aminoglycoside 3'-phosphotransferase-2 [Melghirimyces profundicolus]|uniref:Kanamycin kinase/aminoglycoside 3'-phosphotransferase-2 n=1 Tax=Melghirimyces profundicolus TaxID=1242148 RepID=A0A2T6BGV9_9BACL|nr:APH(3') family aminoglycoside O-phosphotransferase [Melghirimyces profundicolus]PTX55308.1 kanamycin kinase/aminoglycoside 3'-phosphotransferase-2 [Melghirimyces profundicolus]
MMTLPHALRRWTAGMEWRRESVGKSGAMVFRLEKGRQVQYLKVRPRDNRLEPLSREREVLRWLERRLPVPEVLDYEETRSAEFLLMSGIPGRMPMDLRVDKSRIVRWLGEGLRYIHELPPDPCPWSRPNDLLVKVAAARVEKGWVDESDFDPHRRGRTAEELLDELLRTCPREEDPVFTHGDYTLSNILMTENGISGLIDWGRAAVADRYTDLAIGSRSLASHLGSEWVPFFFKAYGLNGVNWEKLRFYRLLDEFF